MSKSTLRWAVIVLTVITALIHLAIGLGAVTTGQMQTLGILWLLNFAGYSVLLGGFLGVTPVLKDNKTLTHYALMGFAAVTIVAYVLMSGILNGEPITPFAIIDKVDEVLLIVATYMHMRA
jgi:hypothetical protein